MVKQSELKHLKPSDVKLNPDNPRLIKDDKFKKLVKSIKEFPEMTTIRPIIVDEDMVILGGNMRYRAMVEAGIKKIPVIVVEGLTPEKKREFIIKDNVSFGEWDWDLLTGSWSHEELEDWGMNVPLLPEAVDYSVIEDEGGSDGSESSLSDMTGNVRKGIIIDFDLEDFKMASDEINFWRERGMYVGKFLIDKLKEERVS